MAFCRPMRTAVFFEELEPRLLFSADFAGVDIEVLEQDVAEEPAVVADLESTAESDEASALPEEDEEITESTAPEDPGDEMEIAEGEAGEIEETDEPAESPDSGKSDTGGADNPHAASDSDSGGNQGNPTADSGEDTTALPMAGAGDEPENIAPVLTQPDGTYEYSGGEQTLIIAPAATVTDADSDNLFQGTLTVNISEGGTDDDELLIVEGGDVSLLNNNIKVEQKLVGQFAGGSDGTSLVISWSPQATPADAEAVLRQIAYSNDSAELTGSRTVDFVLTDGDGGTSNTVQSIINLAGDGGQNSGQGEGEGDGEGEKGGGEESPGGNLAPVLTLAGGPFNYASGGQAILIAPAATVVDVDSADLKQGTLTVSFSQGGGSRDQLQIVEGGDVSLLNNNIKVGQKLVGSFAGGTGGSPLIISWSPQATPAYAEAVLRQIGYSHGSAEPTLGSRTVDFVLTDGDGGSSNTCQAFVNVTAGSGSPGEDPGKGGGDGENDDAGGGVTPPVDKPVPPGNGRQEIPESGQERDPSVSDGFGSLTPADSPSFESVVLEKTEFEATDGRTDFLPAAGKWLDEPDSVGEFREKDASADNENQAGQEDGQTFLAGSRSGSDEGAPNPDGTAVVEKVGEGDGSSLAEQPSAAAEQSVGDVFHEESASQTIKSTIGRLLDFFAPSAATAAPVSALNPDSVSDETSTDNEKVSLEVEVMRREMEEAFLQSNTLGKLMVYTTTGASLSLTAGIARYLFSTGSLLSGFLATIPLWKGFDPVAILSTPKIHRKSTGAIAPSAGVETFDQKAETMFAAKGEA